ncbi:MAG: response regulator [Desulfuromonadales bacterium]|jgi:DNA-binding NtrC family response regulator|nr:response regulator [Desulfuromonadales bacterium]
MKRILIVDDEENTRIGLGKLLSLDGYQVDTVENGKEALAFLQTNQVSLVITDINMPQMNGMAFLSEVNREYPQINVIMMTAYGGVGSYLEAMNLGAREYINKPIRMDELKMVMQRIFYGSSASPA